MDDLDIITMEQARLVCRVDGTELDSEIEALKQAAEHYVANSVNEGQAIATDPRVVAAVMAKLRMSFRPLENNKHLDDQVTALILQIRGGA